MVQKYGKPYIFLVLTCNLRLEEIVSRLLLGQIAQDHPNQATCVFCAKYEELKRESMSTECLGRPLRGLPHGHMLIILNEDGKLSTLKDYDKNVRAEIPNRNDKLDLYRTVIKWMIHGPWGIPNKRSPCEKHVPYKRNYLRKFSTVT